MLTGLKAWLWLTDALDCGPTWQVLRHFDTPEQAYFADPAEYELIPKLTPAHRARLRNKSLQRADQILADCDAAGISILTWQDSLYPERLRNIDLPPLVLYWRGTLPRFDEEIAIAMAGTRTATPYGRMAAGQLAYQITRLGGLVLTGVVAGCDHHAADGALKAGGPLVCVTAGGVDVPYPKENRFLYQDVAAVGALISEYPPGTPHRAEQFPIRNRLISGLSLGVVAVECARFSGTMRTIDHALDQNRDVFAVPGNIDAPMSQGPNWLIQQGARPVTCGEDILADYWDQFPQKLAHAKALEPEHLRQRLELPAKAQKEEPKPEPQQEKSKEKPGRPKISLSEQRERFTEDQLVVLHAMLEGADTADVLVDRTQIPARRGLSALTMLQVDGAAEQRPGGRYAPLVELEQE